MAMNLDHLDHLDVFELTELKREYSQYIEEINKKLANKNIHKLKGNIEPFEDDVLGYNDSRLKHYLEITDIEDIFFLKKSFNTPFDNRKKRLTSEKLILLNSKAKALANSYGFTRPNQLFGITYEYRYHKQSHPLLQNEFFLELSQRIKKLSYLNEIFQDKDNCINYQGVYTSFMYIKRYLKETLIIDSIEDDHQLVFKDYNNKVKIVTENIGSIANELLDLRESIPGSRLVVFNKILSATADKKPNTPITYWQRNLIDTIAYGTTLEKLESKDYSDAKQLIYLPYKK